MPQNDDLTKEMLQNRGAQLKDCLITECRNMLISLRTSFKAEVLALRDS